MMFEAALLSVILVWPVLAYGQTPKAQAQVAPVGDRVDNRLDQLQAAPSDPVTEPQIDERATDGAGAVETEQLAPGDGRPAVEVEQTKNGAKDRCDPANWPDGERPRDLNCGQAVTPEATPDNERSNEGLTREELLQDLMDSGQLDSSSPDIISERLGERDPNLGDDALGAASQRQGQAQTGRSRDGPASALVPEAPGALGAHHGIPSPGLGPVILPAQ